VKFVSLTNGDAGHQTQGGEELAKRRRAEAQEAGRRTGIEYEVLDNHDGKLLPALDVREQVIREIRQWKADVVIGPRPNDYHPDHRYTGVLVQDASYMVIVPNIVKDTPPLPRNPVFLYYSDRFAKPQPFRPDIVVSIDDAFQKKIDMLDARPTDTPVYASSDISRWILQDGGPRWSRCLLPCRTLSFPATCRFIPAHPD
jgi:LmbE family N-acetylglucosaminyl deacetylase